MLPGLVDQMSADGKLPADDQLSGMLGSLQSQAQSLFGGK
jgi:uncharacterized protein YidB (DUF937 family)